MHDATNVNDAEAMLSARIARGLHALHATAAAQLRLHFAARIAGAQLAARGDVTAIIASLISERDAALARLRDLQREEKALAWSGLRRRGRVSRAAPRRPRNGWRLGAPPRLR